MQEQGRREPPDPRVALGDAPGVACRPKRHARDSTSYRFRTSEKIRPRRKTFLLSAKWRMILQTTRTIIEISHKRTTPPAAKNILAIRQKADDSSNDAHNHRNFAQTNNPACGGKHPRNPPKGGLHHQTPRTSCVEVSPRFCRLRRQNLRREAQKG